MLRDESSLGPSPCDQCISRRRCAAENLACERYIAFHDGASLARWSLAPNLAPTRAKWGRFRRAGSARWTPAGHIRERDAPPKRIAP